MIRISSLILCALALLQSCGPRDPHLASIEELEARLDNNQQAVSQGTATLDSALVLDLSRKQEAWAHSKPKDTLAPVLLMRAANNALLLGDGARAYTLFAMLLRQYATHRLAEPALFQMASVAHVELGQPTDALRLYKAYLSQYPEGKQARVAREAIVFFETLPDSANTRLLHMMQTNRIADSLAGKLPPAAGR